MREITGTHYRTLSREKEDKGVDPWSLRMKREKPLMVQKSFLTTVYGNKRQTEERANARH